MIVTVAVDGRLRVNVALNRPSFMSTVAYLPTYGEYSAWKAVDGNKDPVGMKVGNSCAATDLPAVNPWWAVDLGAALSVLGVLFTNRAEGFGNVYSFLPLLVAVCRTIVYSVCVCVCVCNYPTS